MVTTLLYAIGAFLLILILIGIFAPNTAVVLNDWRHFYADYQIPSQEFYERVQAKIEEINLPKVEFEKVQFFEAHVLSAMRSYLKVSRNEHRFYISSAHFGNGSYVSWWYAEEIEGVLDKIPILSRWLGRDRKNKTFYQLDSEAMYKAAVHDCVLAVLDDMTKFNVQRPLSDIERQYRDIPIA